MKSMSRNLLALLFLLFGCGGDLKADLATKDLPQDWLGAWQDKESVLNIQADRILEHDGRTLSVRGLIRCEGSDLILRNLGMPERWTVEHTGSTLRVTTTKDNAATVRTYRRLRRIPKQVRLEPLDLPRSRPLRFDRVNAIQAEIAKRFQEEQTVLQGSDPSARLAQFKPIREKNLRFLQDLMREVGWIDLERFGAKTSVQAALMAKHTDDLRLLMTILPHAEDGKARTYAILYDALQLDLGRKQRYGTQVQEDPEGRPYYLPLEDPDRVDVYLQELGLPPLATYGTQISQAVFSGKPIELRPEDGP